MAVWGMPLGDENSTLFMRTAHTTIAVSCSNRTVGWPGSGAEVRWEASDLCRCGLRPVPHPGSRGYFPAGRERVSLAASFTPVTHIAFLFFFHFEVKLTKVAGKNMSRGGQNQMTNEGVWKIHHAAVRRPLESIAVQRSERAVLERIVCLLACLWWWQ